MKCSKHVSDPELIRALTKSYSRSKRKLEEDIAGTYRYRAEELEHSLYIVKHMEAILRSMDEKDKLIIQKEVIEGRKGKWYEEFYTSSTYYRRRKAAYRAFLEELGQ
ncbi:MAG: hypothetical protein IKE21_04550 [Erysipelotrichaceae bacterium]|nr:hypothetical protein [Erysipelotrichaceae bacterium]